jgi:hypothetical protein
MVKLSSCLRIKALDAVQLYCSILFFEHMESIKIMKKILLVIMSFMIAIALLILAPNGLLGFYGMVAVGATIIGIVVHKNAWVYGFIMGIFLAASMTIALMQIVGTYSSSFFHTATGSLDLHITFFLKICVMVILSSLIAEFASKLSQMRSLHH